MTKASAQAATESPGQQPAYRRKLIEVAIPLEAINLEAANLKRKAPSGYPTMLHKYWAQRPLAACRAVLFTQLVDDPGSVPAEFVSEDAQKSERQRLFRIIEDLVKWENSNDEEILYRARMEIARSVARSKGIRFDKKLGKREVLAFLAEHAPPVLDPFCGGGSIPLEAQRLGLRSYGSDLNPLAVLITKALIEIPPKFAGQPPVNPGARGADKKAGTKQASTQGRIGASSWKGACGLADDVRYYGQWMRDQAEKRIGHLYGRVKVPVELGGGEATVVAWLWARTVKCPNPACAVQTPIVRSFQLSTKKGKEAFAVPIRTASGFKFQVSAQRPEALGKGSKERNGATCLACKSPVDNARLREQSTAMGIGSELMAIVVEGTKGRTYLSPSANLELPARPLLPELGHLMPDNPRWFSPPGYGLKSFGDLFTSRQLIALTTFSDLVSEVRHCVLEDAARLGMLPGPRLEEGGDGAEAYADAVATYLAFSVNRLADYGNSLSTWRPKDNAMRSAFSKQAVTMVWDYAEGSPFADSSSGFDQCVEVVAKVLDKLPSSVNPGTVIQSDATRHIPSGVIVATDPPYYDNIGYADLSDFFYIWLRRSLRSVYPKLTGTVVTPKTPELIASPYRFPDAENPKHAAKDFFEAGMFSFFQNACAASNPFAPATVYYAFKQSETEDDTDDEDDVSSLSATASTGWETMLEGLIRGGFMIGGTWPLRTEGDNRQVGVGTNALASSIVLVCHPRPPSSKSVSRREFEVVLRKEIDGAIRALQAASVPGPDLPQSSIGPGMAVFSRYKSVLVPDGAGGTRDMTVREALEMINKVLDEVNTDVEGDIDAETRVAISWFEGHGWEAGKSGDLEGQQLVARNISAKALEEAGVFEIKGGKARLLKREELPTDWDPATDPRLTVWECLQHAIRVLRTQDSQACGALVAKMRGRADDVRTLAYRMYTMCERKKWAEEARAYNELIADWLHIMEAANRASSEWKGPLDQFGTR